LRGDDDVRVADPDTGIADTELVPEVISRVS
jgi:hypothetical protein